MHIPGAGEESTASDIEDIFLDDDKYISSCSKFAYLGSIYTPSLKCSTDVKNRINKAQKLFFSLNKLVFRNGSLSLQIRKRIYVATGVNILLWGCEAWALTVEDRRALEVFHNRCCQRILNITIYDVIADNSLSNKNILRELGMSELSTYLEVRRAR